ncbi:hypothetical protein [Chitinophaga deserti]|uniref:hypothetical protein n=1 Tax=Chitinophaga deserti TaxID=2164099 RepID=UPI000D6D1878|nr:hypothetical protein [Chitinophaga deserti]
MAILDAMMPFTGKLGNVISYKRNGKHCLRTVPQTVRQTDNTRRAAKTFGAASRKGALIRSAFTPELDIHPDRMLVNRLNSYIVAAGRNNHAGLKGFRFNGHTGLCKFFGKLPVFSNDGKLHIPPQALTTCEDAVRMEIKVIASRIDFSTRTLTGTDTARINIDLIRPVQHFHQFEGADLWVNVPGKGTLVVVVQIKFFWEDFDIRDRKFEVADILAVVEDKPLQAPITKTAPRKKLTPIPAEPTCNTAPVQNGQPLIQRE